VNEIALLLVAVLGLVVAGCMAGLAWRLYRDELRRSAARVATLAADIHEAERVRTPAIVGIRPESRIHPVPSRAFDGGLFERRSSYSDSTPELFAFDRAGGTESRLGPVLAVGIIAVAVALALILAIGRGGKQAADSAASATSVAHAPAAPAPIELVSLDQTRDGNRLTVRGSVRNPSSGERFDRLVAEVTYFGRDGQALGNGHATLQPAALGPGMESTFAVTMARGQDVARFRIRFHVDERIVAHVDRRNGNGVPSSATVKP
jgi:hypothetical protein